MPEDLEWTAGCLDCGQIGSVFSSDKIENIRCSQCNSKEFMIEEDRHGTIEWLTCFFEARLKRMG